MREQALKICHISSDQNLIFYFILYNEPRKRRWYLDTPYFQALLEDKKNFFYPVLLIVPTSAGHSRHISQQRVTESLKRSQKMEAWPGVGNLKIDSLSDDATGNSRHLIH